MTAANDVPNALPRAALTILQDPGDVAAVGMALRSVDEAFFQHESQEFVPSTQDAIRYPFKSDMHQSIRGQSVDHAVVQQAINCSVSFSLANSGPIQCSSARESRTRDNQSIPRDESPVADGMCTPA
jgi:hypothetical protein